MARRGLVIAGIALVVGVVAALGFGIATTHSPDDGEVEVSFSEVREAGVLKVDLAEDVFVVWHGGELIALSADAQHVGDDVEFCESAQQFESHSHGERFDVRGFYYAGPARRGLDRFPARIDGDRVFIDLEDPIEGPERGAGPPLEPSGPFCVPV